MTRVRTTGGLPILVGGSFIVAVTEEAGEEPCDCCCTSMDTCWLIEFDLEFLGFIYLDTGGVLGTEWIPYTGNQVIWVDVSDQTNNLRKCNNGVAASDAVVASPGWDLGITHTDLWTAAGNITAGDCEVGVALRLVDDAGIYDNFPTVSEGVNNLSIEEDWTSVGGSATQEVIRGTVTITRVSPSAEGDCDCP